MYPYFEGMTQDIYFHFRDTPYDFPLHFHNKIELFYCFKGSCIKKVDDNEYLLHQGDALIVFPNIAHETLTIEGEEVLESVSVVCKTEFFSALLPEFTTKQPLTPLIPAKKVSAKAAHAFHQIRFAENSAEVLGWTLVILSDFLQQLELMPVRNRDNLALAPRIIEYINEHYQNADLSINHLARVFGYSASYITHIFYEQLKIPFRSYLAALRSEHAAEQILTTDKTLSEIAFDCGFSSLNTFCRCFKKRFDQSPSKYKKATRLKKDAE